MCDVSFSDFQDISFTCMKSTHCSSAYPGEYMTRISSVPKSVISDTLSKNLTGLTLHLILGLILV